MPIQPPYGDIVDVKTPYIDQAANRLYQEQRQRELQRQQQQRQLDDEFSKNMAKVRDADVPYITKLYSDWKLDSQRLSKQGAVDPKDQLENLRKRGVLYKEIFGSQQDLAEEEDLRKDIQKNPDNYDDNASNYLIERRRRPRTEFETYKDAQGNNINLRDYNTYKYKGTDTDFQKILNTAAGTPKQVYQVEEPVGKDNLQFKITPYLYGNTPEQFKESLMSSLHERKAGRDATAIISSVDPVIIDEVDKRYRQIPLETWKRMGVDKPQELLIKNADNKAERYANHQAQLYALNNLPKEGTPVFRDNKEAIEKRKLSNDLFLLNAKHAYDAGDKEKADLWIDKYVSNISEQAKTGKEFTYKFADGRNIDGYKVELDPTLKKALGFDNKNPGTLIVTKDGEYIVAPYAQEWNEKAGAYVPSQKNGTYAVDAEKMAKISADQLKLALGKQSGVSQLNKEMSVQKPSAKNYTYKGKTYTDEQVTQAAQNLGMTKEAYLKKYNIK